MYAMHDADTHHSPHSKSFGKPSRTRTKDTAIGNNLQELPCPSAARRNGLPWNLRPAITAVVAAFRCLRSVIGFAEQNLSAKVPVQKPENPTQSTAQLFPPQLYRQNSPE
jgi:hypothetical protein